MPEQQFLTDGQSHRDVADLLTRQRGSSKVVWAGVGQVSAGVGESEMGAIRNAIGAFPSPFPAKNCMLLPLLSQTPRSARTASLGAGPNCLLGRRNAKRSGPPQLPNWPALGRPGHALGRYSAGPPTLKRLRRLGGRAS